MAATPTLVTPASLVAVSVQVVPPVRFTGRFPLQATVPEPLMSPVQLYEHAVALTQAQLAVPLTGHLLGGPGTFRNAEHAGRPSQVTDAAEVVSPAPFLPVSVQVMPLVIWKGVVPVQGMAPDEVVSPLHE